MNIVLFGSAAVLRPGDVIESNSRFYRPPLDETVLLSQTMEKITLEALATGKWRRSPNGSFTWILPVTGSGVESRNVNVEAMKIIEEARNASDSAPSVTDVLVRHKDGTSDRYTLTQQEFQAFKATGTLDDKQNVTKILEVATAWSKPPAVAVPEKEKPILTYVLLAALAYLSFK